MTQDQADQADPAEKVREDRLRLEAERRGYVLEQSSETDPQALDYGTYQLRSIATSEVIHAEWPPTLVGYGLTLDQVEEWCDLGGVGLGEVDDAETEAELADAAAVLADERDRIAREGA